MHTYNWKDFTAANSTGAYLSIPEYRSELLKKILEEKYSNTVSYNVLRYNLKA